MKIYLKQSELAVLVLQINIMRKSIKKALKRNYGLIEFKKHLSNYDSLKEVLENELELLNDVKWDNDDAFINLVEITDEQAEIFHSFLTHYSKELIFQAEKEGTNLEDNELVLLLERIKAVLDEEMDLISV